MRIESMDTTKKITRPQKEGTEDTQVAQPIEAADTIMRHPEEPAPVTEKGPGVVVHPKTEKEEFLERFGMYDEPEELEEQKEIRAQINAEPEAPAHFLEKEVPDEKKQEKFLEDLVIRLQAIVGVNIDRDEVGEIIEGDKDIYDKIKTLLVISRAKNFKNLQTRRDIFEEIHNFLDAKYKKDKRQILNELANTDASQEEKNRLGAQILNPLEQNYKTKMIDFKNEYLGLNLRLTKEEVGELQTLSDKQMEINKVRELGEEIEDLTDEEYKKLKKLSEKNRIIQELEEI